jgi:predicted transcriptional regulator
MSDNLISSQKKIAEMLGISQPTVSRYISAGILKPDKIEGSRKYFDPQRLQRLKIKEHTNLKRFEFIEE